MNEPPEESIITRYLLENPWPAGIFLLLAGFVLLALWNSRGENRLGWASLACFVTGSLVFLIASMSMTAGEHARELVARIVQHAEDGDAGRILAELEPDATLHLESLKQPGRPFEELEESIRSLESSNRVTEIRIGKLRAWTTSPDSAIVHLGCRASTGSSWGPVPTTWSFVVRRNAEGDWKVKRIAFTSLAGQPPSRVLR